jgi:hypothetical protein
LIFKNINYQLINNLVMFTNIKNITNIKYIKNITNITNIKNIILNYNITSYFVPKNNIYLGRWNYKNYEKYSYWGNNDNCYLHINISNNTSN